MPNITFSKENFLFTIINWNKLDPNLRSATDLSFFKKNLLKFARP